MTVPLEQKFAKKSSARHARVKRFSTRSRTGCRTCRARRVKCDEAPGACNNCTSTKRVCEGYDAHRIPTVRWPRKAAADASRPISGCLIDGGLPTMDLAISSKVQWKVTSDERRCLSFFQYRSVPQLVAFFDSPVWQQLILQLCYHEPAVFHAVVALGAVNQGHELARKTRAHPPGPSQRKALQTKNKWYLFALEQSGRSFALLNRRRMSEDPYLQTIILVCCLLFVMCELLHRNIATAVCHVQSGLRILHGMKISRHVCGLNLTGPSMFDESIVETFLGLQGSSVFFGTKETLPIDQSFVFQQPYDMYLQTFTSLQQARKVLSPLLHTLWLFVAQCMKASDAQRAAMYATLQRRQLLLLTYFARFLQHFDAFCMTTYGTTVFSSVSIPMSLSQATRKAYRTAELTRLAVITSIFCTKTATALTNQSQPLPKFYVAECEAIIAAAENAMRNLKADLDGDSPTLTPQHEIVPAVYVAAVRCADLGVCCRGIAALREWNSEEGFMSSSLCAAILEEALKKRLKNLYNCAEWPGSVSYRMGVDGWVTARIVYSVDGEERMHTVSLKRNEDLVEDLLAIEGSRDWPCVRALGLLDHI
ncbi:hypothetical protein BDW72DRAFT_211497 [Aspergillus terricola var. indicus]